MRELGQNTEGFKLTYGRSPQYVGYAPGRVTIIGAHLDYNGGPVICAALPIGTIVSIAANVPGKVRITSEQKKSAASLAPGELARDNDLAWTKYIVGVLTELELTKGGLDIYVSSELPMGRGLASSAALTAATAMAALQMPGRNRNIDIPRLCQRVEHQYLGIPCGILDPFTAIHCQEGSLLHLNCRSMQHRYLQFPKDLSIVICDTGASRELAKTMYNTRREECLQLAQKAGTKWLAELLPDQIRDLDLTNSAGLFRRIMHVSNEVNRVHAFAQAVASCDYDALQKIMLDSHASCRDLFECSTPELDCLVQIASTIPSCIGARLTGAGWGGATVNLVRRGMISDFCGRVGTEYRHQTGRNVSFLEVFRPGQPAFSRTVSV